MFATSTRKTAFTVLHRGDTIRVARETMGMSQKLSENDVDVTLQQICCRSVGHQHRHGNVTQQNLGNSTEHSFGKG